MPSASTAARLYASLIALVCAFQLALAMGAPWGRFAMGGAFPGVMPPAMRVAAVVQALVLAGLAWVLLKRAGPRPGRPVRIAAWIAVAVNALSLVLNTITPSGGERLLWAPVALALSVLSLRVALAR